MGEVRPHLLFREATLPDLHRTGSREVPLAVNERRTACLPYYWRFEIGSRKLEVGRWNTALDGKRPSNYQIPPSGLQSQ